MSIFGTFEIMHQVLKENILDKSDYMKFWIIEFGALKLAVMRFSHGSSRFFFLDALVTDKQKLKVRTAPQNLSTICM